MAVQLESNAQRNVKSDGTQEACWCSSKVTLHVRGIGIPTPTSVQLGNALNQRVLLVTMSHAQILLVEAEVQTCCRAELLYSARNFSNVIVSRTLNHELLRILLAARL